MALQRVTSRFMQDLYEEQTDDRWIADGLHVIRHVGGRSSRVFGSGGPFQLAQLHIGLVMSGEQDVTVNLRRHHLTKAALLVASPESIMQEGGRSEDFDMQVLLLDDNLLRSVFGDPIPSIFAHRMSDHIFCTDDPTYKLLLTMFDALWQAVHTPYHASSNSQLMAILDLIVALSQRDEQLQTHQPRDVAVFNRFVSLVAEYCDKQRTLDFYADKLCLSKQYLGSLISKVSHRSASEWIEEASLARIKVMLLHSRASLGEISESMSFPEPSHFSRYFKRLTGMTPNQYRNKGR